MFSGLRGEDLNQRYLDHLRKRVLEPIAAEIRAEFKLPTVEDVPLSIQEIELVWGINARVFYYGQRRWIFDLPLESDLDEMIGITIAHFIEGARKVVPALVKPLVPAKAKRKSA
jgi:hypothetical protein